MDVFFDTETSGLPRNWSAPSSDVGNWPRLVQIAWLCCDTDGHTTQSRQHLIRPTGFKISRQATELHGITTEQALRDGEDLQPILEDFSQAVRSARRLVAHNLEFDVKVVHAEFIRAGLKNAFGGKQRCCTMKESVDYCRIPGPYGFKWPKLAELHTKLFGTGFSGAHGALADTEACMRCYYRLRELDVVE